MTVTRLPRPQWAVALARTILFALVPSFLSDLSNPERRRRPPRQHPTSYLDGLRGLAACAVFAYHYTDYNHKPFLPHYGHNDDGKGSSILQLPYLRLIYSGTPMVHVFFVISGFALSLRPLRTLYNTANPSKGPDGSALAKCHAILASSTFRRPFRIFIPPMMSTLFTATIVQLGYMNGYMKPQETIKAQIDDWLGDGIQKIMYPWAWDEGSPKSRYNPHLWTIPMEFVHSMFLFLVILMCSRLRTPRVRQITLFTIMIGVLMSNRWACFEFVAGALLADTYIYAQLSEPAESEKDGGLIAPVQNVLMSPTYPKADLRKAVPAVLHGCKEAPVIIVLLIAGYILSWPPRKGDMTGSYLWIQGLVPERFVGDKPERARDICLALAAFATVWASGRITLFKRVLNSSIPQYAGKISFCFYILQHPVLNVLQHPVLGAEAKAATAEKPAEGPWGVRGLAGIQTPLQRTTTWFIGLVILGSVLVWLADLFTRIVDGPAVRFARWLEGVAFAKEDTNAEAASQK
ncbi:related to hard surface induced protein 3 (sterol glycosyl transferase) [Cephalotrichum gorgonifer]|uniref:Related to hard surface induced protein 3 (Sterol glycosyl transferase) n=1 Tax=Cephalotrichum gorgonifer TaxID=2041049 RepID=A0AAE8SZ67_9PEZI|nr:related to hard surface induced protein 3 (sterol glycosyl transferase) [Cephalotrichum gorgonifer]